MFDASAQYYDLIYSPLKDYAGEATLIAGLLRRHNPRCLTVLDVACGTGEHARLLAADGFVVDGLDLAPAFLRIAERKHPAGRFFEGDMSGFSLPQRYDAVICLFSSIAYARTLDRVVQALTCCRDHLTPDGIVVIEPWFPPGVLDPARTVTNIGEADGVRVSRSARVQIDGTISRLLFEYEFTEAAGTRKASEVHELGLFTTDELMRAFREAGLDAHYDPKGLSDRGLFVATRTTRG
jgi:SAM-dependent methyltransferase